MGGTSREAAMAKLHDFTLRTIDGSERSLGEFAGRVALLVNVASKCGLTPQYEGLQRIQERFAPRGFDVLGFPCNQFAQQEPGSEAEIQAFCTANYGVTFPLFAKLEVNGAGRHPLYAWLVAQDAPPEGSGDVKWNFCKFLVGKDGRLVARFDPRTEPEAPELVQAIEKALDAR
jgi:glutathione peroxidase